MLSETKAVLSQNSQPEQSFNWKHFHHDVAIIRSLYLSCDIVTISRQWQGQPRVTELGPCVPRRCQCFLKLSQWVSRSSTPEFTQLLVCMSSLITTHPTLFICVAKGQHRQLGRPPFFPSANWLHGFAETDPLSHIMIELTDLEADESLI